MTTTVTTKTGRFEAVRIGTAKVGRWTYPAIEQTDGSVVRNEKTDGSLGWVAVDPSKVAWTTAEIAELVASQPDPKPVETPKLSPAAQYIAQQIADSCTRGKVGFDFFDDGLRDGSGIWLEHAAQQTPNPGAAKRAFRELAKHGLIGIGEPDSDSYGNDRWIWLTQKGADVIATFVGESLGSLPEAKAHTGGGNQTKRPGKSTWELGTPCPQGHTLTADTLYVMPSGRKQCRDCRNSMPSRVSK
ncbi:MAG TPA: hypothetical protein VNN79_15430 [Actinomycetota bacterium]|nr:hypothetical protein [Actinomycetota bacterium]